MSLFLRTIQNLILLKLGHGAQSKLMLYQQ